MSYTIKKKELTPLDFTVCLFAKMVANEIYKVKDSELLPKLYQFREDHPEYFEIFYNIDLKQDWGGYFSSEKLGEGITQCLGFGIIHTYMPFNGYFYIDIDKEYAKELLTSIQNKEVNKMFDELILEFK